MNKVTVIGSGNIGSAVAAIAAKSGASVQVLGRGHKKLEEVAEQTGATTGQVGDAITGDIVVLAVPYPAVAEIANLYGPALDGKTLVDVSNPLNFATFDSLMVPAGSSAAQELQDLVPTANVLKAFNTNFAATLATGKVGDVATTVLIAGNDEASRKQLAEVVEGGGLQVVDAGSLKRAREMEAIGFLQLTLAAAEKIGWTGGFAVQK